MTNQPNNNTEIFKSYIDSNLSHLEYIEIKILILLLNPLGWTHLNQVENISQKRIIDCHIILKKLIYIKNLKENHKEKSILIKK